MSGEGGRANYEFTCPDCGQDLEVNGPMKDALIEKGCVLCGTKPTSESFSRSV